MHKNLIQNLIADFTDLTSDTVRLSLELFVSYSSVYVSCLHNSLLKQKDHSCKTENYDQKRNMQSADCFSEHFFDAEFNGHPFYPDNIKKSFCRRRNISKPVGKLLLKSSKASSDSISFNSLYNLILSEIFEIYSSGNIISRSVSI